MPTAIKLRQSGITLVELMIALVLGLILTAGVSQIFVSSQKTHQVTEELSRVQESARFSFEFLTRDIREAGYSGCRAIEHMNVQSVADAPIPSFSTQSTINGNEATSSSAWAPTLDANISADVIGGTDVITLQKGSSCGATLAGSLSSPNANIQIANPNSCGLNAGDALIISDCEDAHIFRASNVSNGTNQTIAHGSSQNSGTHFCANQTGIGTGACGTGNDKLYGSDAELLQFSSLTYYIGQGAGGRNALWVYENTKVASASNPIELVEGVENLQILYGVDADENDIVDDYETADSVNTAGNWDKVISAEISLLLETQTDNLTTTEQTFNYNGAVVNASDKRFYHVYTTVINIRNRVQ